MTSTDFGRKATVALETLAGETGRQLQGLAGKALGSRVRLAVTGLSRSGKTVFTTALVQNLLLAGERPGLLPFFDVVNSGRLLGARRIGPSKRHAFAYDQAIGLLTQPAPEWPPGTADISELRLAIDYRPASLAGKLLAEKATVTVVVADYPGEWLLDLPLLRKDFAAWSQEVLSLCEKPPRDRLSAPWRQALDELDPLRPAAAQDIARAVDAYKRFLVRCRERAVGLSLVQPGRFVLPGDVDPALLAFCPVALPAGAGRPPRDSLHAEMARRYEAYKAKVVLPFYRDHFRHFDRQIVLVDVLTALNTSYEAFLDARAALLQIMESFHHGRGGWLRRLLRIRITKVLFAATKADHITVNQYNNLRLLLQAMVKEEAGAIRADGATVDFELIAAIKCTKNATLTFQGRAVAALQGVPAGSAEEKVLYPGEIPGAFPSPADWQEDRFQFIDFAPPNLAAAKRNGLRGINLDKALEFLIGDRFA